MRIEDLGLLCVNREGFRYEANRTIRFHPTKELPQGNRSRLRIAAASPLTGGNRTRIRLITRCGVFFFQRNAHKVAFCAELDGDVYGGVEPRRTRKSTLLRGAGHIPALLALQRQGSTMRLKDWLWIAGAPTVSGESQSHLRNGLTGMTAARVRPQRKCNRCGNHTDTRVEPHGVDPVFQLSFTGSWCVFQPLSTSSAWVN